MKTTKIFLSILLLIGFTACKDNKFLDLTNPDAYGEELFYKDSADLESLLTSCYRPLRKCYDNLFFVTEMKSDNASTSNTGDNGGLYATFVTHNVSSNNSIVADLYSNFYICIHRCNQLLEHADAVSMTATERTRMCNEARFLRALCHFYLVRLWGPVVIMPHTITDQKEANSQTRSSVVDVYSFIKTELQDIAQSEDWPNTYGGTDPRFGHATRVAANALLGKLLVQQAATQNRPELYPTAIEYLKKAETLSGFRPNDMTTFAELFTQEYQTSPEVIFSIQYMATSSESAPFPQYFQPSTYEVKEKRPLSQAVGRDFNCGQANLYYEFETMDDDMKADDYRRDTVCIYQRTENCYFTRKYKDLTNSSGYAGTHWFELRFADVYLLLAEAYARIGGHDDEAIQYLDYVRTRVAYYTEKGNPRRLESYSNSTKKSAYRKAYPTLLDAIYHERRMELCFENHRWFDLMRQYPTEQEFVNHMHSVKEKNEGSKYTAFQAYEMLLPIPYDEVFLNPGLGQNPGY